MHELPWKTFEKLLLKVSREIEGAKDVQIYGRQGQRQDGIDLVGFFTDEPTTVYQAKAWKEFAASDLSKAVKKYADGVRPFDATRLVVAVTSYVGDTDVPKKLKDLRDEYKDLTIELWGRDRLSELLEAYPKIVARFFGQASADLFCDGAVSGRVQSEQAPIDADAILRGPLANLNLTRDMAEANRLVKDNPGGAADIYRSIASKLEQSRFVAHASQIRNREAATLEAGNFYDQAALVRLSLGWRLIAAADQWGALQQVSELQKHEDKLPQSTTRAAVALSHAAAFGREYQATIDNLATSFDELREDDSHVFDAGLLLAEQAVAWQRLDLINARADRLEALAGKVLLDDASQISAVRLRMCLADASGEWSRLVRRARTEYRPEVRAWVAARHARHLAVSDQPEQAVQAWEDAAVAATAEGFHSDAGDWLYAARSVHARYGRIFEIDLNEYHRKAQALRVTGSKSLLPRPFPLRERVLSRLRDEKWLDALETLHQYLWHSTVIGDWTDELTCHDDFGDLFVATGKPLDAAVHYVRAGSVKELKSLGDNLPDGILTLPTKLVDGPPWERAAAYRFVARVADLISDDNGREWLARACADVLATVQSQSSIPSDPWHAAFSAMASLISLSTDEQAGQILVLTKSYIPRRPNSYRHTDEDQVRALIALADRDSRLGREAFGQLCEGLLADTQLGQMLLKRGSAVLRSHESQVSNQLADAARDGNFNAAMAIVVAGANAEPIVDMARRSYERAIQPREHQAGRTDFGTDVQSVSLLVAVLGGTEAEEFATAMLAMALDPREAALNRESALQAIMTVAQEIEESARNRIFGEVMAIAAGQFEPSVVDADFGNSSDPFARFRINFGDSSLIPPAAIEAAAVLATAPVEYQQVQERADEQFSTANEGIQQTLGRALSRIPPEHLLLDPRTVINHPIPTIRALAAVKWAVSQERDMAVGRQFAQDGSALVRRSLASALQRNHAESIEQILANDVRRSVRIVLG